MVLRLLNRTIQRSMSLRLAPSARLVLQHFQRLHPLLGKHTQPVSGNYALGLEAKQLRRLNQVLNLTAI